MNTQNRSHLILITFIALTLLSGCASAVSVDACVSDPPYGFIGGLLHGVIAPFSFIASLFMENVAIYAVNNSGGWYDFGFVLGAGILFGGGTKASRR